MEKYALKETKTGVGFSLKAFNGETIGVSEIYSSEAGCMNGIESVRKNAPIALVEDQTITDFKTKLHPKFELYRDKAGEYRFRLKARNGEIILASEGYTKKASCMGGIESVRKNAVTENVVKEEKTK